VYIGKLHLPVLNLLEDNPYRSIQVQPIENNSRFFIGSKAYNSKTTLESPSGILVYDF
jgi:hypothetical protein